MSLFGHFFKTLSSHLQDMILIEVKSRIQVQYRITVKSWNQIWIHIKVMRF